MTKSRIIVELEFDEDKGISRERAMEILGDALYRPDVYLGDPVPNETHDWEELNDGLSFRYISYADSTSYDNLKDYTEAFRIFGKYENTGAFLRAEHDELWAGPDPKSVTTEDKARLEELGWNDYGDGAFHIFT